MAGLLDLLSGRSSDIYGAGLLTPEQRGGLGNIGLLALAGKLGQLAGPSFSPVPDFGAALGQAAGAYGASQEGAGTAALNAILTGQKGRKLEQELDYYKQLGPVLGKLAGDWPGAGGGSAATPETGSSGGGAAAPPGAGGGGGDAPPIPQSEAVDKARYYARLYGVPEEMFLHQINGENGFKASGASSAGAQGIAQFIPSTAKQYGVNVNDVDSSLDGAARYMRDLYKQTGSWEGALRGYLGAKSDATLAPILASNKPYAAAFAAARGGGGRAAPAPTAAAPAPAGGGGLLAPTAPNPLSDAEPMVGIPRRADAPAPAALTPYVGGTTEGPLAPSLWRKGYPGAPGQRADLGGADTVPGQGGALEEPPGFAGRQLVAQLLARPPIDDVNQYRQVAGPGAADAAATPRAPLPTMGPAGIELPPTQGPLAAPAPAAPAPAAPGPGLLSPPGMPAAPALPRVNPAYDTLLRNLGIAGALAKGAGLPDVFSPFSGALEKSPGYLGEAAKATEAGRRAVADPAEMRLKQYQSLLDLTRGWAEKGLRIGADGKTIEEVPGYRDTQTALTAAEAGAKEKARADAQKQLDDNQAMLTRETDRQRQNREAGFKTDKVQVLGPDGRSQEISMSQYEQAYRRQQTNERIAAGNVAPQPGDIVGLPTFNDFEKGIQSGGIDFFNKAHTAADAAAKNIQWNNESIKLLDSGLYAGWGAPVALQFARIFNIGGKSEQEKIQNTEKFLLERGQQVAAQAKLLPGSASDKDVAFLTSLALGTTSLNEGTIRQMLELYNKYNRQTVDQYNDAAGRIRPDVIGGLPLKVPVDPPLQPLDPESRKNAEDAIRRGAKPGPIRNQIRSKGFDPEGL